MVIPDSFNRKYLTDEITAQYERKMATAYTSTSKFFRWCPTDDCQFGVEVEDTCAQAIECRCGQVYCFKCGQEDHRPCSCDDAEDWIKNGSKIGGEIVHEKWLLAYTKLCPICHSRVEKKNRGNFIVCPNIICRYEFCWQCRKGSKYHNYHCEVDGNKKQVEDLKEFLPILKDISVVKIL